MQCAWTQTKEKENYLHLWATWPCTWGILWGQNKAWLINTIHDYISVILQRSGKEINVQEQDKSEKLKNTTDKSQYSENQKSLWKRSPKSVKRDRLEDSEGLSCGN